MVLVGLARPHALLLRAGPRQALRAFATTYGQVWQHAWFGKCGHRPLREGLEARRRKNTGAPRVRACTLGIHLSRGTSRRQESRRSPTRSRFERERQVLELVRSGRSLAALGMTGWC